MQIIRPAMALVLVGAFTVFGQSLQPPALPGGEPVGAFRLTTDAFRFSTSDFWLNLHQFLYVLGRAQNRERDASRIAVAGAPGDAERGLATLSPEEQGVWRSAVDFYAEGPSRKDGVFDAPLVKTAQQLAAAGAATSLNDPGIDPKLAEVLGRTASVYRRAFWPNHEAANQAWATRVGSLLAAHERSILAFVTRVYDAPWPRGGFPAHVTAYTNWAGAFSTDGPLLLLSSLDSGLEGSQALETVFHEAMHQWDQRVLTDLHRVARDRGVKVADWLSHAMIFYTAGEATRRSVPGHVPYAEASGIWARGREPLRKALEAAWKPWLDGCGTREEALANLVVRASAESR